MSAVINWLRNYYKLVVTIIFFTIAICWVMYLFPHEGKFRYEFQKGKPWMHDILIAPFDFPIYKSDIELQQEKDSILKQLKPYFNYNSAIESKYLEKFNEDYEKKWELFLEELGKKKKQKINKKSYSEIKVKGNKFSNHILKLIYSQGILDVTDGITQTNSKVYNLVIVRDKMAKETEAKKIFTLKTSYEYILEQAKNNTSERNKKHKDTIYELIKFLDLNEYLFPNISYDPNTSNKVQKDALSHISLTYGMVQAGERIISKGDLVTHKKFGILESLKKEYETNIWESNDYNFILLGQLLLIISIYLVLFLFLNNFRPGILKSPKETLFILLLNLLMVSLAAFTVKYSLFNIFIIPFALLPIIVKTFYDARLALFIHMATIITVGFFAPNSFEFLFLNFISGITAILSLSNQYRRGKLFIAAILVTFTYSFVYFGIAITQEGKFETVNWINFAYFAANGLLTLVAYPLIWGFEKLFGYLSDATLIELSDTNQPLLRKLAEKAPGTFQHCLQVANLAEEAVFKIGGNPLLARTGALYHDIGKMANPIYFTENQGGGFNPHDKHEYDESSSIIINHVLDGIEMAKKAGLPDQIIDFIRTHHGTTKTQYFYKMYKKKYPDRVIDESRFTYPGPTPNTKETAVLMMADSIEAASRSLKDVSHRSIKDLVDNIVNYQMIEEQFNDADITYKDISSIKEVFKKKLLNIYHARIEYPK